MIRYGAPDPAVATAHEVPAGADLAGSLAAFASALTLPAWFGRNLDALVDALRDLPGPLTLVWTGTAALRAADPGAYGAILTVLTQVDAERADLEVVVS